MQTKHLIIALSAALGLTGAFVYAAGRSDSGPIPTPPTAGPVADAGQSASAAMSGSIPGSRTGSVNQGARAPSVADVGDVDSFGQNVHWLGQKSAYFGVSTDCATWTDGDPSVLCQQVNGPVNANTDTNFTFNDIARFELPANASNSLLCHWLTPMFQVYFINNTGTNAVVGSVRYRVNATIENAALTDPSLMDPTTGAPFNGRLTTGSLTYDVFQTALVPDFPLTTTQRKTVTCISGMISKRALIESYGLTGSQANKFFKNPMTVRLNVSGGTRFVESMTFTLGLRLMGD